MHTARSILSLLLLGVAACARPVAPPPDPVIVRDVHEDAGTVRAEQAVTVSATVVQIDQKDRLVTLLGPDGEEVLFRAGPEVRNLAQVKRGDMVQATYYESLAIDVRKPGEATPGVTAAADSDRAAPGERPGAATAESVTVTATVVKVDERKRTVTLRGPKGNVKTLPVKNPMHLGVVKAGDLVQVTYTEAIGIEVSPPTKQ